MSGKRYREEFKKDAVQQVVERGYSVPEVAERLGVKPHWLYRLIKLGVIDIKLDPDKRMYLFPDSAQVIADLASLRDGTLQRVRI